VRCWLVALALVLLMPASAHAQSPRLARYLEQVPAASLVPGAEAYGPVRTDLPVAPILQGGNTVGWAFVTSDLVSTTGYSGKPIDVLVAVGTDAVLRGVKLVKHSEPIVLVGIPEAKVAAMTAAYAGLDLAAEAKAGGSGHDLKIISGATVTVMVIDDSIVRAGLRVARALGLGGLTATAARAGPRFEIKPDAQAPKDWLSLVGDGSVRRLSLDVGQVNRAFADLPDPRAAQRPEPGDPDRTFIDMYAALVSIPALGEVLLGPQERANLEQWLKPGEHALLVAGRGAYSFKGSGYVRGGLFDRIQLIQNDISVRFRDKDHRRLGEIAAPGAPQGLTEVDLFRIPAESGFDPTQPWRLQLLVQREVGAIERLYSTFDLHYRAPQAYVREIASAAASPAKIDSPPDAEAEHAAKAALWQRVWRDRAFEIAGLLLMLAALSGAFFFQMRLTRSAAATFWFRISFLTLTLVFIGWYANAQLSIVNLMALVSSMRSGFNWDTFLLDPMVFILWFSVAAALILWGRGAYCGWLCPFGALQELTNRVARYFRVPQWELPWGLNERLWAVKYILFLGLAGVTLASIDQAERLAEVEPFKTSIILKFDRSWPYVLYAVSLLGIGLFVERFYCRYLCPLGAALAIPARIRVFDWMKRYRDCGNPCKTCARECMVQAIHPTGEISPNECLNCLNCQVLYQSPTKCPVVIKKLKRSGVLPRGGEAIAAARLDLHASKPLAKETANV
jgi:NosR/NirI family nitrous oxide reductase transcriptional regulator